MDERSDDSGEEKKSAPKRFLSWLAHPGAARAAVTVVLTLACIAGSMVMLAFGLSSHPAAYVLFASAAVMLAYAIYLIIKYASRVKAAAKEKLASHAFSGKLISDYGFRTAVSSVISFSLAALFAVVSGVMAIVALSVWYGVLAAYYLCLCAVRVAVTVAGRRAQKADDVPRAKLSVYFGCGAALLVLETALCASVTLRLLGSVTNASDEIMAIATAAYTFTKVIMAIANMIKARKLHDPVVQSLRNIAIIDALVSLLALEMTMVTVFGGEDGADISIPTGAVIGFVICALTMGMGIFMMIRASVLKKRLPALAGDPAEGED